MFLALAGFFWGLFWAIGGQGGSLEATLWYLALINTVLAGVNIKPEQIPGLRWTLMAGLPIVTFGAGIGVWRMRRKG